MAADIEESISSNLDEATKCWSDNWSVSSTHNHDSRGFQRLKQVLTDVEKQEDVNITFENIRKRVSVSRIVRPVDQMV